jgi:hypothetical protein
MSFNTNNRVVIDDDRKGYFTGINSVTVSNLSKGFQGSNFGYSSGGQTFPNAVNIIDRFPFASSSNATDVGDLSLSRKASAGQSSYVSGYTSGGLVTVPGSSSVNNIDKFSFATGGNAIGVGTLRSAGNGFAGASSSDNGYLMGGTIIDKFPFASESYVTNVGSTTVSRSSGAGQSSVTHGYLSGGVTGGNHNVIDRFPFATNSNASDVGDLTPASGRYGIAGQSSTAHGYNSGGHTGFPAGLTVIDKFPFATNNNATNVGSLSTARGSVAGQSSTTHGYISGGSNFSTSNVIDRFPFATDGNATDFGDLTVGRYGLTGQQY